MSSGVLLLSWNWRWWTGWWTLSHGEVVGIVVGGSGTLRALHGDRGLDVLLVQLWNRVGGDNASETWVGLCATGATKRRVAVHGWGADWVDLHVANSVGD